MKPQATTLTGQELAIMKLVWGREKATVRQVYEELLKSRAIAYTTVMTMMKILEQKGHLKKTQEDRAYVYTPVKPRKQVIGSMVREFLQRVFDGSAEPLVAHLVENEDLDEASLDQIKKSIRAARAGKKAEKS